MLRLFELSSGRADPFDVELWHRIAHYGIGAGQLPNTKAVLGIPILRDAKVKHITVIHRNSNPFPCVVVALPPKP